MTKEEAIKDMTQMFQAAVKEAYQDLIDKAVEVEREECAKVCDEWGQAAGMYLAATIRERSEK